MKPHLYIVALVSTILLSACSNPVKEELISYVQKIKELSPQEQKAIDAYGQVFGANYTDDQTSYDVLLKDIVPAYRDLQAAATTYASSLKTKEVKDLHEIYLDSLNTRFSAMTTMVAGLEKQDMVLLTKANTQLAAGQKSSRQFNDKFIELLAKNGIQHK